MNSKLPVLRDRELIAILEKLGFKCTRKSRGSHFRFCHPDSRRTTVHKGKTIGKGLLRKILKDIDLSVEELDKLR